MKLHHIGIVVPKIKDSIGEITNYIKLETIERWNNKKMGGMMVDFDADKAQVIQWVDDYINSFPESNQIRVKINRILYK